jgi:hypothetical protein
LFSIDVGLQEEGEARNKKSWRLAALLIRLRVELTVATVAVVIVSAVCSSGGCLLNCLICVSFICIILIVK